jgi:hypothetical protein
MMGGGQEDFMGSFSNKNAYMGSSKNQVAQ